MAHRALTSQGVFIANRLWLMILSRTILSRQKLAEEIDSAGTLARHFQRLKLRVPRSPHLPVSGTSLEMINRLKKMHREKVLDAILPTLRESPSAKQIVLRVTAESYVQDASQLGFIKTPFMHSLRRKYAQKLASPIQRRDAKFPVLVAPDHLDLSAVAEWLAESLFEAEALRVDHEADLETWLRSGEQRKPLVLIGLDTYNVSLVVAAEGKTQNSKLAMLTTQQFSTQKDKSAPRPLRGWTTKLIQRFMPEAFPDEEVSCQGKWMDAGAGTIANSSELKQWIMDPAVWAGGGLPTDVIASKLAS